MRKKTLKYMIVTVGTLLIATRLFQQKAPAYDKCEVILDAGHGGQDSGAVYGGFMEKDFNLEMAHEVRRCLEQKGIKVHMTRYKDEALGENELSDLKRRVQLANHTSCKYFVSLHANASNNHLAHGFEIYTNKKGTALANAVSAALATQKDIRNNGVFDGNRLYVVRNTLMNSILIEVSYLDQTTDKQILNHPDKRKALAKLIAEGIFQEMKNCD